jgi:hypothetical protein
MSEVVRNRRARSASLLPGSCAQESAHHAGWLVEQSAAVVCRMGRAEMIDT